MTDDRTPTPPFTVLHVCGGNTCRSAMAERLFAARVDARGATTSVYSHSCGVDHRQVGSAMNPPAAAQVAARGGDSFGFRARHLAREHVEASDLILAATGDQVAYIVDAYPDAAERTFQLNHFGLIAAAIAPDELPTDVAGERRIMARGMALVTLADGRRADHDGVDVADPWGADDATFGRIASSIDESLGMVVARLLG
ncbi:low molecular weight phosphatase family protein [Stackebrandtia soli]|uniref:arsenate-mycothiol transferase ArsC n=1 Tax=Stackebrandtia soli TaxID=1892856 RepID=UPI0039E86874